MKKITGVICSMVLIFCLFAGAIPVSAAGDKTIEKIELSGVVNAAIGKAPSTDSIKVPSGAGYIIDSTKWHNSTDYTSIIPKFEDGRKYRLTVVLSPKSGYAFDNAVTLTVNGKTVTGKHEFIGEQISVELTYSFLKKIDKIDLPKFPDKVPIGENNVQSSDPVIEKTEYNVYSYWMERYTSGDMLTQGEVGGTFVEGRLYAFEYRIGVNKGYEITEKTVITVGGKAVFGIYNYIGDSTASIYRTYNHSNLKAIEEIALTVGTPELGKKVDDACKVSVTSAKLSEFAVDDSANASPLIPSELGNQKLTNAPSTGNYQEGRYYFAKGILKAESGYYFSENLRVTLNGKEIKGFCYMANSMFDQLSPMEYFVFNASIGGLEKVETPSSDKDITSSEEATSSVTDNSKEVPSDTDVSSDSVESKPDESVTGEAVSEDNGGSGTVIVVVIAAVAAALLGGAALWFFKFRKK